MASSLGANHACQLRPQPLLQVLMLTVSVMLAYFVCSERTSN